MDEGILGVERNRMRLSRVAFSILVILGAPVLARAQVASPVPAHGGSIVSVQHVRDYDVDSIRASIPSFFETYPAPVVRHVVRKYALAFTSRDFDGSPVTILAQVYVPKLDAPSARPVYVFASGTTGIGDNCAPSLETPETKRWGWYEQNMLAYAALGFIVVFPDYTGFNDPGRPQRYFSKAAEAYMMLDAIRAGLAMFPLEGTGASPSKAVFAAGYSQGGHAAMAAADLRQRYSPDVPLAGVVTYGSTNDVEALVREGPAYAPLIFYSYMDMYGRDAIKPGDFLQDRWMPTFERDASTMPVDEFQAYYGFDHSKLYKPAFAASLYGGALARDFPELRRLFAENHTGLSGHGIPALVIQGDADFIATTATQTKFVLALRDKGSRVKFLIYPKVSHRYTRMAGFQASVDWMAALAAGLVE